LVLAYVACCTSGAAVLRLLYYKRYIDDIFAIWLPPDKDKISTWNDFKKELNNWGHLKWVIEDPSLNYIPRSQLTSQRVLSYNLYIPKRTESLPIHTTGFLSPI
jgi:hypothetical protein